MENVSFYGRENKSLLVLALVSYAFAYNMDSEELSQLWDGYIDGWEIGAALANLESHPWIDRFTIQDYLRAHPEVSDKWNQLRGGIILRAGK
jgi:hypothetical protein